MFKHLNWFMVVGLILVGCIPTPSTSPTASEEPPIEPTQAIQPTDTLEVGPPTEPQNSDDLVIPDVRIRISTTSDWTVFKLVDGAILDDTEILSSSSVATTASFEDDQFELIQPISQAEGGNSVELVADLSFTEGSLSENLEFEIDRGHIGATTVEIYSFACGEPAPVDTFTWEDIQASGENVQSFSIPTAQLSAPSQNEYTVIAQLNFWYYGPGEHGGFENSSGERMTPLTPLLGETYWASDPDVVHQQIEWASEYGVDAFSIEWTTPRGIGCCGSMEDTLDDVFLESPNIHKVRWAIFYDFVLRLAQTPGLERHVGTFDFDEPEVYDTFVSDFKHFAQKYFGHPQYLTIDERPVIYIWATNAYVGNLEGALREAREEVAKIGFDVFIVGDEISADRFDSYHASLFDGNTTFTFLIGGLDFFSWNDIGDAIEGVDQTFEWWSENIRDLKVIDRDEKVNFQPAWAPQYDDRFFIASQGIYIPANSKDQVVAMAEVARKHAEPVGGQDQKLIWLNTWNYWAETTTVEPTADLGPKYPAGNYQFDMLEVVRDVFGPDTFLCNPP
jgi:hypothetical protein